MDPGPSQPHVTPLRFTGTGGEYFRIWIVNLLLSLVTLGVYSAWAKVRKAKYFRCNTQLGGHVFDYHGNPRAILRGRLMALALFTLYSWGFQFSKHAMLVTMVLLGALAPWLFVRAQQFAFGNTSFRGLRFGFDATARGAYWSLLPMLAVWWAPEATGLAAVKTWSALAGLVLPVAWPWMHHRLKAYQHGHARYGDRDFEFVPALGRFYLAYLKGVGFVIAAFAVGVMGLISAFSMVDTSDADSWNFRALVWPIAGGMFLLFYLMVWPYYTARLQQLIWNQTHAGDIRFRMDMRAVALFQLVFKNTLLTVLSCGLYWPWAVVALARYRAECLVVESDRPLSMLAGAIHAPAVSATGEGAMDAFGLDIGL